MGTTLKRKSLATTYFPADLRQYHRRGSAWRPCSGWKRVGPLRSEPLMPHTAFLAAGRGPVLRPRSRRGILSGKVEVKKYAHAVKITANTKSDPL